MDQKSIMILGVNPISESLISRLNRQGYALTIVDKPSAHLNSIASRYDVQTISGHPSHPDVLQSAHSADTSTLIAMTDVDEVNIVACQIGHAALKIPVIIASISSPHYLEKSQIFGEHTSTIDHLISHEQSIFEDIEHLITYPGYKHIWPLSQDFFAVSFEIDSTHPFAQRTLLEISDSLPKGTIIAGLNRQGSWLSYRKTIKATEHDIALLITQRPQLAHLISQPSMKEHKKILILGISHITHILCHHLQHSQTITVIEPDSHKCQELSQHYPNITIINDDPQDQNVLTNQNIEKALVIVASSDDEDNLIYSFHAHDCHAPHLFTVINRIRQGHIFEHSPIDYTILTPQIISDEIIRNLLKPNHINYFYTRTNLIQLADIKIHAQHPHLGQSIRNLDVPKNCHIGAIIRKGQVLFTDKSTHIQLDDHIIVYGHHCQEDINPIELMVFNSTR